jgi:hypothetical protein
VVLAISPLRLPTHRGGWTQQVQHLATLAPSLLTLLRRLHGDVMQGDVSGGGVLSDGVVWGRAQLVVLVLAHTTQRVVLCAQRVGCVML